MSSNRLSWVRSLLFVPGTDEHRFARAAASGADAVIFDLEDAVPPEHKEQARSTVTRALSLPGMTEPLRLVRVNELTNEDGREDLAALEASEVDGIVVPKAEPGALSALSVEGPPVIAMIETATGLRATHEIACHSRVEALMLGAADLGAELGLAPRADGQELLFARSTLVVDSAAAGLRRPFDVVHLDVRNEATLRHEAELAKSLGFAGKPCIHPAQVATVNDVFSPSEDELSAARRVVDAYESAMRNGSGVALVGEQMIDMPVVLRARMTLEIGERHANSRHAYRE